VFSFFITTKRRKGEEWCINWGMGTSSMPFDNWYCSPKVATEERLKEVGDRRLDTRTRE
jgi:hypothetical protein